MPTDFKEYIYMALNLFDSDHSFDAERTFSRAERALNSAIRSQNPRLIPKLLMSIHHCLRSTNGKLVLLKIQRWALIAIKIFSHHHLLARSIALMYSFLTELETASLLVGIENVWISTVNCIEFALNPLYYSSLRRRVEYISKAIMNHDPEHGLSIFRQLLGSCDAKCCGLEDTRPVEVRRYMAYCLGNFGYFEEAIIAATKIIERTLRCGFLLHWVNWF